jgi:hypothetical protein
MLFSFILSFTIFQGALNLSTDGFFIFNIFINETKAIDLMPNAVPIMRRDNKAVSF